MLHPSKQSRERILLFGPYGSGKSWAWATVGAWQRKSSASSRIFALDTDYNWERMAEAFDNTDNVTVQNVDYNEWDTLISGTEKFSKMAKPGNNDWLIVDMIDKAWDYAQAGFSEKAFGKEIDEWFVEAKRSGEGITGDYGSNWVVINRMYGRFMGMVQRFPGHVLCCTPSDTVTRPDRGGKGGDDKDILDLFGRFGVKPKGQKSLGHQFHSVLLLADKGNEWVYTTVKDRTRERVNQKKLTDFVSDYLVPIAGWKP